MQKLKQGGLIHNSCRIVRQDRPYPDSHSEAIKLVGIVVLLLMLMVRRKMDGKPAIEFNGKAIATTLYGVFSTAVFGMGMCMVMVWDMMIWGIVVGD